MHWAEAVARVEGAGGAHALVYAGALAGGAGCAPPPRSWAAEPGADVGVFVVRLPPGGALTLPAAAGGDGTSRVALVTLGAGVEVEGARTPRRARVALRGGAPAALRNGAAEDAEVLVLQGRPIGEPVAQRGPFVMNAAAELREAAEDFARTGFGGWPFEEEEVVFPRARGRFARHPGGREELPPKV
jgi:redox-sensitive bicupin YhaK (pirin superfamily)